MKYAQDNNGVLKYPTDAEFVGIPNWDQHDQAQRSMGYMPLVGEADDRDGYTASPATWHIVHQSTTRTEPRQAYEEDEQGRTQMVMRDDNITVDTSYIQVDSWEYAEIPPAPAPVVRYSKYKIQLASQKRNLWEQVKSAIATAGLQDSWSNIVDIASDNEELDRALPAIRDMFGTDVVNAVLEESIV